MSSRRLNLRQSSSLPRLICVVLLSVTLGAVSTHVLPRHMLDWEWRATGRLVRSAAASHGLDRLFTDAERRRHRPRLEESLPAGLPAKGRGATVWFTWPAGAGDGEGQHAEA